MSALTGKRVLITGASKGIGAATAQVFAQAGAKVGLAARSTDKLSSLVDEIGPAARALTCDVASADSVNAAVAEMEEAFGGVDILINNAAVLEPIADISTADPTAWGKLIDINIKGVFYGIQAVLPGMKRQGGGTIITISSGAAHSPYEGWSAYCTSKAGAAMLTDCLHHEMQGHGIRAMGLSPGTVATDMQVKIRASGINPVSQIDPAAHVPADWPARMLLWMCTPDADEFIGQEIKLRDEDIRRRAGLIS